MVSIKASNTKTQTTPKTFLFELYCFMSALTETETLKPFLAHIAHIPQLYSSVAWYDDI